MTFYRENLLNIMERLTKFGGGHVGSLKKKIQSKAKKSLVEIIDMSSKITGLRRKNEILCQFLNSESVPVFMTNHFFIKKIAYMDSVIMTVTSSDSEKDD